MCARCPSYLLPIHLLSQTDDLEEKARYAKWKAADIAKAFREGRVPQSGPPNGEGLSVGDRPISPPSDFDDLSLSSSALGIPPCVPPEHPSPRKTFEHKLPPAGPSTKTPVRHAGVPDGVWSNVATPGLETPGGPASPLPFSLAAVLNASQRDVNPKPRSGLNKVAAPSPLKGQGDDTDPEDGDDGWSTIANPFSRQNSVTLAGASPPDSAAVGASFTTNLTSLSEGMCHLVATWKFVSKYVYRTLFSTLWRIPYLKTCECPERCSSCFCRLIPQHSLYSYPTVQVQKRPTKTRQVHPRYQRSSRSWPSAKWQ